MGWNLPRDVQDESIPLILGGGDVVISAPTGSGKTGALSIPIIQVLYERLRGEALITSALSNLDANASTSKSPWNMIAVMNAENATPISNTTLSLTASNRDQGIHAWGLARSTFGISDNNTKAYVELSSPNFQIARLGFSRPGVGMLGVDRFSYGVGSTGKKSTGNAFEDCPSFGPNDVVGLLIDTKRGVISMTLNGKDQGILYDNIIEITPNDPRTYLHLAVALKGAGEMNINGDGPFIYKNLPKDVVPLFKAKINTETVTNNNTKYQRNSKKSGHATNSVQPMQPFALVLQPTRELAIQFCGELRKFCKNLTNPTINIGLRCPDGGVLSAGMMKEASCENPHILVATPAATSYAIKNDELVLSQCEFLLLDEADGLLVPGSGREQVFDIHRQIAKNKQVVMCSATMLAGDPSAVNRLCNRPQNIDLSSESLVPETVEQLAWYLDPLKDLSWVPKEWGTDEQVYELLQKIVQPLRDRSLNLMKVGPKKGVENTSTTTTTATTYTSSDLFQIAPPQQWVLRKSLPSNVALVNMAQAAHIADLANRPDAANEIASQASTPGAVAASIPATSFSRPTLEWIRRYTDTIHDDIFDSFPQISTLFKPTSSIVPQTQALNTWIRAVGSPDIFAEELLSIGVKVLKLLSALAVIDQLQPAQAMIFCRTRLDCDNLTDLLTDIGLRTTTLHSSVKGDGGRSGAIASFKEGTVRFLTCTDVGARGVDVRGLPLVLCLTLTEASSYVHRVGRTGRAGRPGFAISLLGLVSPTSKIPLSIDASISTITSSVTHGNTATSTSLDCTSIVEKVWFHRCNSKNPLDCHDTRPDKGCATWLNEEDVMKEVRMSLGGIEVPGITYNELICGAEILSVKARQASGAGGLDALESERTRQHVAILKPFAQELYRLELNAQKAYTNQTRNIQQWKNMLQKQK